MKVVTWNVNSLRVRADHLARFADDFDPDVVCLQETKVIDGEFPLERVQRAGFEHVAFFGQRTYNGVALLSKHPLEEVQKGLSTLEDDQARTISAVVRGVRIYGVYTPNGTELGTDKFAYKLRWLKALRAELDRWSTGDEVLLCGDMNVAPDDADVWDPFHFDGRLLCTPEERSGLQHVLDWGLTDAYRHQQPFASEFTWWDYQRASFQRNQGLRIDHVYLSSSLLSRLGEVKVHRNTRAWEKPSDHAPVSVTLR